MASAAPTFLAESQTARLPVTGRARPLRLGGTSWSGASRLLLAALLASLLPAEDYQITPRPGNSLALEVFKTGFLRGKKHLFHFDRYHGKLSYHAPKPESSQIELVIEAAGAVLKDTWLSPKDFRKVQQHTLDDMLAAGRYPQIRFSSDAIRPAVRDQYEVTGTLTIRGVSRPAAVQVRVKPGPVFEGAARVKMTEFGLKPPTAALGTVGTRDEMTFSFVLLPSPPP